VLGSHSDQGGTLKNFQFQDKESRFGELEPYQ